MQLDKLERQLSFWWCQLFTTSFLFVLHLESDLGERRKKKKRKNNPFWSSSLWFFIIWDQLNISPSPSSSSSFFILHLFFFCFFFPTNLLGGTPCLFVVCCVLFGFHEHDVNRVCLFACFTTGIYIVFDLVYGVEKSLKWVISHHFPFIIFLFFVDFLFFPFLFFHLSLLFISSLWYSCWCWIISCLSFVCCVVCLKKKKKKKTSSTKERRSISRNEILRHQTVACEFLVFDIPQHCRNCCCLCNNLIWSNLSCRDCRLQQWNGWDHHCRCKSTCSYLSCCWVFDWSIWRKSQSLVQCFLLSHNMLHHAHIGACRSCNLVCVYWIHILCSQCSIDVCRCDCCGRKMYWNCIRFVCSLFGTWFGFFPIFVCFDEICCRWFLGITSNDSHVDVVVLDLFCVFVSYWSIKRWSLGTSCPRKTHKRNPGKWRWKRFSLGIRPKREKRKKLKWYRAEQWKQEGIAWNIYLNKREEEFSLNVLHSCKPTSCCNKQRDKKDQAKHHTTYYKLSQSENKKDPLMIIIGFANNVT